MSETRSLVQRSLDRWRGLCLFRAWQRIPKVRGFAFSRLTARNIRRCSVCVSERFKPRCQIERGLLSNLFTGIRLFVPLDWHCTTVAHPHATPDLRFDHAANRTATSYLPSSRSSQSDHACIIFARSSSMIRCVFRLYASRILF